MAGKLPGEMSILDHLEELRDRLIRSILALAVGTAISFVFTTPIMRWLIAPAGIRPVFLRPTEMFITYFRVAMLAGVILAMPFIVYQLMRFLWPGLERKERRYLALVVPSFR